MPDFVLKSTKEQKLVRDSQEEKKPITDYLALLSSELEFLSQFSCRKINPGTHVRITMPVVIHNQPTEFTIRFSAKFLKNYDH